MGGIWGIGASLAFETVKSEKRGFVSGLMQSGYATGYLGASLVFGFFYALLGWRGLFMIGLLPAAFLIGYIWLTVTESPAHDVRRASQIKMPVLLTQVAGDPDRRFLDLSAGGQCSVSEFRLVWRRRDRAGGGDCRLFRLALCPPALEAAAVCRGADDGFQFLQPWHAGHLSHLPAEAAWLRSRHRLADRGALQYRRHRRRTDLRQL